MSFLKKPNLPEHRVTHVICSYDSEVYSQLLEKYGVIAINCNRSMLIHNSTCSHADMLFNHLGGKNFVVDKENDTFKNTLKDIGCNAVTIKEPIRGLYPDDCKLNCAVVGENLLCNTKTVDKSLLMYYKNNGYRIIDTKQGYTKCNVCIVNDRAIITSDMSIYENASKFLDVLLIESGHIKLYGYDYGFIGGATGLIDKNKLEFI